MGKKDTHLWSFGSWFSWLSSSSGTWLAISVEFEEVGTNINSVSLSSEVTLDDSGLWRSDVDGDFVGFDSCDDFVGFHIVAGL